MASIKFNCVIDGKKTSTTLSENLVRFYLNALKNDDLLIGNDRIGYDFILRTDRGYHFGIDAKTKAIIQKQITSWRDLKTPDEIEFKILRYIAYRTKIAK